MTYAKRWAGGFVDGSAGGTPIDSTFLNAVEAALIALYGVAPATNGALVWDGAKFTAANLIKAAQIDPAAAIAKTQLAALGVVNADVSGAAAIAYSKLNLTGQLLNADIAAGAGIVQSKLSLTTVPTAFKVSGVYDLNTSTTESSLISGATSSGTTGWQIPANTLGASGGIRVRLLGDYLNNSGAGQNLTLKVKFGGTVFWGDLEANAASATRTMVWLDFILANVGATNVNYAGGTVYRRFTSTPVGAGSAGGLQTYDDAHQSIVPWGSTAQAIDTTSAQFLDITALHGGSASTVSIRRLFATAEYL